MTNEELQSKTITFLRFPLMVGVVLIHAHINEVVVNGVNLLSVCVGGGKYAVYQTLANLISEVFASVCVPLFFFISGFLFFYNSSFSYSTYLSKLKKRVRTVLIPYLFWNALVIVFFFLAQSFFTSLLSGENKLVADYSIEDWLEAFWARPYPVDHPNCRPIAFQFWFIRDLMVVMAFSPAIYVLVKYLHSFGVFVLGVMWLVGGFDFGVPGFSIVAFFCFSAGAYFSVHGKDFTTSFSSVLPYSSVIYLIIALVDLCTKGSASNQYIHLIGIIIGCIFVIGFTATCIDKGLWKVNTTLSKSTFFLYAYHGLPLALLAKLAIIKFPPTSDLALMTLYLGSAAIICILGVVFYNLLKKIMPEFTSVITGGR